MGKLSSMTVVSLAALIIACTPATPGTSTVVAPPSQPASQRTLVVALRVEPASLLLRPPREVFFFVDYLMMFNADIAAVDDHGARLPYLVESLPQVNSDSWQVFADGRMRTIYRLRPNLTWHDGTPLSAEDFVFGYQVYATPDIGLSQQPPFNAIEQVEAPDARTLVINWKRPYPDAGHMTGRDRNFPAVPRHLLEGYFASESVEAFLTRPYWSREFLGLGPYRVANWEPGSFIEAVSFEGHATGKPKIDRLKVVFIPDANTALANMLSGEVAVAAAGTLSIAGAQTLKQEWDAKRGGSVFYQFPNWHGLSVQFLPALTSPRALQDVRVRKALAHAIDRPEINEAINGGIAQEADYYLSPDGEWGREVQRGAIKYGYDLQRSEQLMREAGFEKGSDGIYSSPTEGAFNVEVRSGIGAAALELAALADNWERAGFRITQRTFAPALLLDPEVKLGLPGMFLTTLLATERTAVAPVPGNIPTPDNGWRGGSQISWTHPEYTRLVGQLNSTLDRAQRGEPMTQMARISTDDVAVISLHFPPAIWAATASVTGPHEAPPEAVVFWNIHTWESS